MVSLPVGTERKYNGYIRVKTASGAWAYKHRQLWELHSGPIPKGHRVVFSDGNKQNCVIENLKCIPYRWDVGSERIRAKGYVYVKISSGKWLPKHRHVWEKCNGPVPEGNVITFRDGNKLNCAIENLACVPGKEIIRNNFGVPIGTERVVDGCVIVKVAESGKWVKKQQHMWEQYHGPIPEGHQICFLDGNRQNFTIENLECTPRVAPPGTEFTKNGYIYVKIISGEWVRKHRHVWEQHNGPIPVDYVITFRDGNSYNCEVDNLECIPCGELSIRSRLNFHSLPTPLKNVARNMVRLVSTARTKEKEFQSLPSSPEAK